MPRLAPVAGEVYAAPLERVPGWVVVQVLGVKADRYGRRTAVVDLAWDRPDPPSSADLDALQPRTRTVPHPLPGRPSVEPHALWCWGVMPATHRLVGTSPPRLDADAVPASSGWGALTVRRDRPERVPPLPPDLLEARAAAYAPNRSTWVVGRDRLMSGEHVLTAGHADLDGPVPGLVEHLERHPFLVEATLRSHGLAELDLSRTWIDRLSVDATGLRTLRLPASVTSLTLTGMVDDLAVVAVDDGRWVSLGLTGRVPALRGLDAIRSLGVHRVDGLDLHDVTDRWRGLHSLGLGGRPGTLAGLAAVRTLTDLRALTVRDLFGITVDDLPGPDDLPALERLVFESVPADVVPALRRAWRTAHREGRIDLDVRKPRRPEWLAANLDNPFRDWDGDERITPTQARRAAALYRRLRADVGTDADAAVTSYIEGFNALDRTGWIETVERDQIWAALTGVLGGLDIDGADRLLDLADGLRDW